MAVWKATNSLDARALKWLAPHDGGERPTYRPLTCGLGLVRQLTADLLKGEERRDADALAWLVAVDAGRCRRSGVHHVLLASELISILPPSVPS